MVQSISEAELIRIFTVRTQTVRTQQEFMLFLGVGASATYGIPTASEMIWLFKREIFSQKKILAKIVLKTYLLIALESQFRNYIESSLGTKT